MKNKTKFDNTAIGLELYANGTVIGQSKHRIIIGYQTLVEFGSEFYRNPISI